jgi:VanZ family protein
VTFFATFRSFEEDDMERDTGNDARLSRRAVARARAAASRAPLRHVALAAAIAAAFAAPDARAQTDGWTSPDKALHFGLSAPFGAFAATLAPKDAGTGQRMLYGAALGALPGLAKELSDARRSGADASARDMAFNVLGAAVGALLADCCLIRPIARGDRIDGVGVEYRVEF